MKKIGGGLKMELALCELLLRSNSLFACHIVCALLKKFKCIKTVFSHLTA